MASANIFVASTFIDDEETIASLSPVALIQRPICVLKNLIIIIHTISANISANAVFTVSLES